MVTEIKKRYEAYSYLYYKYVYVQKSMEEIIEGTEVKSLHAIHFVEFENMYYISI